MDEVTVPVLSCNQDSMQVVLCPDLARSLPVTSSRGYKYIFVLYVYDVNPILLENMKNRTQEEHLCAYNALYLCLICAGFKPKLHCLDNEASEFIKQKNG